LAILSKASAAHMGLFFCLLVFGKFRFRAVRQIRLWVFGALALLPSLLWYRHAHQLWLTYGNSLGISNETHWAGMDLFTNPDFILGIGRAELLFAWMPTGFILALLAVVLRRHSKVVSTSVYWLIGVGAFYLIAARTTGDSWAVYYHVVSIPPVALMIGSGVEAVTHLKYQRSLLRTLGVASVVLIAVLAITGLLHLSSVDVRLVVKLAILSGLSVLLLALLVFGRNEEDRVGFSSRVNALVIYFAAVCLAATCLFQIRKIRDDFAARNAEGSLYMCAGKFAPAIPSNVLIVASGGPCLDPTGYPVAYNSSYMFYWLDRKGFSICVEQQSLDGLNLLTARGARYFVAEKAALKMRPAFEDEVRRTFPLVTECEDASLFQLKPIQMLTRTGRD